MNRFAWTLILAWSLPLSLVEFAPCEAQQPASSTTAARTAPPQSRRSALSTTRTVSQARRPASPTPTLPASSPVGDQRTLNSLASVPIELKAAPLELTDLRFPINLATALRLSDARPLIVASAQASTWVAEAQLTRAKVLWIPTLVYGADYIRHDGGGPDFNKGIMTAPSVNYLYGGGAADMYVNLTDAIFQPLAARQVLNSRHWDVQTAKNDALLDTADAYFMVHQYRGMYAGALYSVERGRDLVERISQLSKELVTKVEVYRARTFWPTLSSKPRRRGNSGVCTGRPDASSSSGPSRWSSRRSTITSRSP